MFSLSLSLSNKQINLKKKIENNLYDMVSDIKMLILKNSIHSFDVVAISDIRQDPDRVLPFLGPCELPVSVDAALSFQMKL